MCVFSTVRQNFAYLVDKRRQGTRFVWSRYGQKCPFSRLTSIYFNTLKNVCNESSRRQDAVVGDTSIQGCFEFGFNMQLTTVQSKYVSHKVCRTSPCPFSRVLTVFIHSTCTMGRSRSLLRRRQRATTQWISQPDALATLQAKAEACVACRCSQGNRP